MPEKRYSKEVIVQTLQNLAKRLGKKNLSKADVAKVISVSTVHYYFGSLGNALEAAGLERKTGFEHLNRGKQITDEELFQSILFFEKEFGHLPGYNEYSAWKGGYSVGPFRSRWGKWGDALTHYRKWKAENPRVEVEHNEVSTSQSGAKIKTAKEEEHIQSHSLVIRKTPQQLYGTPIDFRGMRHAPINEQGVVYLFGMVSRELGFYIEALQQGFPDCEGKYLYNKNKGFWAKARIEFEYKASNFKDHGHDPNQCDFIICWINDWPDCPINVIELKTEILKLPSN